MTDNVRKVFEILGVEPGEAFKLRECICNEFCRDDYKIDELLNVCEKKENAYMWKISENFSIKEILINKFTIVKLPKKKKLRDLTEEEFDLWSEKHCYLDSDDECEKCPFRCVTCTSNDDYCWVNHKDLFSDKFLDQEIEVE